MQPSLPEHARLFSVVTIVKGRLSQLQRNLPSMYSQSNADVVVVDYSCPEGSGSWVKEHFPPVKLVVVKAADFHLSAARNAGASAVTTPWICFVDVDIELAPTFLSEMSRLVVPGSFYLSKTRGDGMAGFILCEASIFRQIGGYDEKIRNVGREDTDLVWAFVRQGCQGVWLAGNIGKHHGHSLESRVRYYSVKDMAESYRINDSYLKAKWGAVRYPSSSWPELQW